jgi:hypothetical protein
MKRIELVRKIKSLKEGLSLIANFINDNIHKKNGKTSFDLIKLTNVTVNEFDEVQKDILKLIDLDTILDNKYWASAVEKPFDDHKFYRPEHEILSKAIQKLNQLTLLLDQEKLDVISQKNLIKTEKENNNAIISLIILDLRNDSNNLERVSFSFEGILLLYQNIATLLNENPNSASVIRFDSGSEKQYDLLGVKAVIEAIGELLDKLWKNTAFYNLDKKSRELDNLLKTIEVFNAIGEAESNGNMPKEQAEIIRRGITKGILKTIKSKTVIENINLENKQGELKKFLEPPLLKAPKKQKDLPENNDDASKNN